MMQVLLIIHLLITVSLVGMVLLQRSEGGGLGMGGGGGAGGGFMTTRGTANAMTHTTVILAAGFFVTSISLSILAGVQRSGPDFVVDTGTPDAIELMNFPVDSAGDEAGSDEGDAAPTLPEVPSDD